MARSKTAFLIVSLAAVLALGGVPAGAKVNDPNVRLHFVPQQNVAQVSADVHGAMLDTPVAIRLEDGRAGSAPDAIGTRTDDDDRLFTLLATTDVVPYVEGVLIELATKWGVVVDPAAERALEGSLVRFEVTETNQAVGATFRAAVTLRFRLRRAGDRTTWSGTGRGEAYRYGKKFSNENVNEVLSDALLQAFAAVLSDPELEAAWRGEASMSADPDSRRHTPPDAEPGHHGGPQTPGELLSKVRELMERGFDPMTIEDFLGRQKLTERLSADDLARWKQAGVPEQLIRVALSLSVE